MSDAVFYAELLADGQRVEGFRQAIQRVVKPGDTVVDVGTGLGTYAFMAAQAGAGRVWGVERGPVINVARELAALNGFSDRVELIHGTVPETALPSPVDVLIFEDFPRVLLDGPTHRLLTHAQAAMGPRARMVPCAARLRVAPVRSAFGPRPVRPPGSDGDDVLGLDWTPLDLLLANCCRRADLAPADLAGPALGSPDVPLHPLPSPSALGVEGRWRPESDVLVRGLALWFDLEVSPGIWISNQPAETPGAWGQTWLPVDPPLEVAPSRPVDIAVRRESLEGGAPGWLSWKVETGGEVRRGHEFAGLLLGPGDVHVVAPPDDSGTPGPPGVEAGEP